MNVLLPNLSQIAENPHSSPKIFVRILLTPNKEETVVQYLILICNPTRANSSLFLNVIEFNPKASLGVNGGTIPSQNLVSDKKIK